MNFALGAILIVILLLPGAIALDAYYSTFKNKEANLNIPLSDSLIKGIFWSLAIHASSLCLLTYYNYEVDFRFLYDIIIGKDIKDINITYSIFSKYAKQFIFYIAIVIISSWLISKFFKYIINLLRLNINYNAFRNYNYWFYIFSDNYSEGMRKIFRDGSDLIYLDVMVTSDVIYCGILIDFNYSPHKDVLENIVLEGAKRRVVDKENSKIKEAIPIPGDILVINMKDVLNINVKYLKISAFIEPPENTAALIN
ncbi:hypothetical protein GALL_108840 [mine drainage metagenome]|uniref:Uncharacterized protein n=1 Tax=mine drainage metagenome TaxID=410659 RepID=A0A1J5SEW7_9ZZZZ